MIFGKLKILRSHGRQAIPDLSRVELAPTFRGRPELTLTDDMSDVERAAEMCPTGAISVEPFSLDMGRCLFCGECARCARRNIRFTNDYRIGATRREDLVVRPGQSVVPFEQSVVRADIRRMFSRSLQLREVSAGGDASIEMELGATGNVNFDFGRFGVRFTASPRHADGLVLTGPVTVNMAEALEICYDSIPAPKLLIVCGSEACSGGLFARSGAVDRSFFERHEVDLWLPGAPTHPMTFIEAVTRLRGEAGEDRK